MAASHAALAQSTFQPVGEEYRFEAVVGEWNPPPDLEMRRDASSSGGTPVNFASDLGCRPGRFVMTRFVVRPAPRHKARVEFLPLSYEAGAETKKGIVFDEARFVAGDRVVSSFTWRAWRFGYEYDLVSRPRGYLGVIGELKYADIAAAIAGSQAAGAARPKTVLPGVGAIGRVYLTPNIALTAEVTGFRLPDSPDRQGRYLDYDVAGILNFTKNIGAAAGTRSMALRYLHHRDAARLEVREKYFAAVVRF